MSDNLKTHSSFILPFWNGNSDQFILLKKKKPNLFTTSMHMKNKLDYNSRGQQFLKARN